MALARSKRPVRREALTFHELEGHGEPLPHTAIALTAEGLGPRLGDDPLDREGTRHLGDLLVALPGHDEQRAPEVREVLGERGERLEQKLHPVRHLGRRLAREEERVEHEEEDDVALAAARLDGAREGLVVGHPQVFSSEPNERSQLELPSAVARTSRSDPWSLS